MENFFKTNKRRLDYYHELFLDNPSIFSNYWGLGFISIIWNNLCAVIIVTLVPIIFIGYNILVIFMCIINFAYHIYFKSYYIKKEKKRLKEIEIQKEIENAKKVLLLKNSIKEWVYNYQKKLDNIKPYVLKIKKKDNSLKSFDSRNQYSQEGFLPKHRYGLDFYNEANRVQEYEEFQIKDRNLNSFISNFFKEYVYNCITMDKTERYICGINRRRSLHDLYLICKNYFPECTFEDVLKTVINMTKNYTPSLNYSFCRDVNKYVFYISVISNHIQGDSKLEFNDSISFNDLKIYYKNEK